MLGDENNNQQVDLESVKLESCALLVIDELGDPTGGPLETVLLEPTLTLLGCARRTCSARARYLRERRPHPPGLDKELALWGRARHRGLA